MANLIIRFPNGLNKAVTLSYDDGVEQDIKLISIMQKYGLKGTFNINSGLYAPEGYQYPAGQTHRRMSKSKVLDLYKNSGMEVAVHGLTHPFWNELPTYAAAYDIIEDKKNLEEEFDCFIRGAAYPYGAYNDDVVDILAKAGICYCRTVISSHNFYLPKDWLRLEATCHHNDPMLMQLVDDFLDDSPVKHSSLFYLWGHSYEFEDRDNWDVIEKFAQKIGGRNNVWYATNIEIYEYVEAYKRLVFTAVMDKVYNPTQKDIWFSYNDKEYVVKAGETICIA